MTDKNSESKIFRILSMYDRINSGKGIVDKKMAEIFEVNERTIQRDRGEIKLYLNKEYSNRELVYVNKETGHCIKHGGELAMTDHDIFCICKVLLDSRAFNREEMEQVLERLLRETEEENGIKRAIANERINYTPPNHGEKLIKKVWELSEYIREQETLDVKYKKQDGTIREYEINPLGLLFNEYYFYLMAERNKTETPVAQVYRIDRFIEFKPTGKNFNIDYLTRFKEGDFRDKTQFMYTGKLTTVTFKFWGDSLEAVLDRLPTSEIIKKEGDVYFIQAKVHWEGVKRWLLSQGSCFEVLKPQNCRDEVIEIIDNMRRNYQ